MSRWEFTDEEVAKLPKWAQSKVRDLERRVRVAEDRATQSRLESQGDADTFLYPYDDIPVGLCKGDPVRFQLKLGVAPGHYRNCIDVSVREHGTYGRVLQISGSDSIMIYPNASNVCYIKHTRD